MRNLLVSSLLLFFLCASEVAWSQATQPTTRPRRQQQPPRTLYVAPTGDDAATGTKEQPFKTLQHGSSVLNPGDTLIIAGGTYKERVLLQRGGFYLGRPITIKAADGEKVILDAEGVPQMGWGIFDTNGMDYLVISGIHVQNSTNCGFAISKSWQVRLENCSTTNSATSGIMIDKSGMVEVLKSEVTKACQRGGEESISVKRSQDVTVADSYIHHTGHEGIDVKEGSKNVRIINNRLHDVERQCLYAEAWDSPTSDILFENNVVYNSLFGIAAGSECGGVLSDVRIINNIVYGCRGPGIIMADWGNQRYKHPVRDIQIIGNTVYGNGVKGGWGGGIVFENTDAQNITIENNLLAKNEGGQFRTSQNKRPASMTLRNNRIDGETEQIGENIVGPIPFANPAEGDFRLSADR